MFDLYTITKADDYIQKHLEVPSINWKGPLSCHNCWKACRDIGEFIRHVGHTKSCKAAYDQTAFEKLKKQSNLKSRRKWYKERIKMEKRLDGGVHK